MQVIYSLLYISLRVRVIASNDLSYNEGIGIVSREFRAKANRNFLSSVSEEILRFYERKIISMFSLSP